MGHNFSETYADELCFLGHYSIKRDSFPELEQIMQTRSLWITKYSSFKVTKLGQLIHFEYKHHKAKSI